MFADDIDVEGDDPDLAVSYNDISDQRLSTEAPSAAADLSTCPSPSSTTAASRLSSSSSSHSPTPSSVSPGTSRRPKIWSLADLATSADFPTPRKSQPPYPSPAYEVFPAPPAHAQLVRSAYGVMSDAHNTDTHWSRDMQICQGEWIVKRSDLILLCLFFFLYFSFNRCFIVKKNPQFSTRLIIAQRLY